MILQLKSMVLVMWWDKLPGLWDLVGEVKEEVMEEARTEEVDNMEVVETSHLLLHITKQISHLCRRIPASISSWLSWIPR